MLEDQSTRHNVINLTTIKYALLKQNDPVEVSRLLKVCLEDGFFYLDMEDGVEPQILQRVQNMYKFMMSWFGQPHSVKMENVQTNYRDGYKPTGYFSGVLEGTKDCYESLKVSHNSLDGLETLKSVEMQRTLFEGYLEDAREASLHLLKSLSDALGLEEGKRFERYHHERQFSNSTLVLLRYPKSAKDTNQIGHNKHTDIGSITYLYTDQWGLQVMDPSRGWQYIEPRSNCAVINVGDSLRFLSGKKLRSCLHRVVPVKESCSDRHTIAYFLRPDDNVEFLDSNEKITSAKEWHDRKYQVFKASHEDQRKETILTGGIESAVATF